METRMQSYFISFINIMHADVGIFLSRCFNVLKEMHRNFRKKNDNWDKECMPTGYIFESAKSNI